MKNEIVITATGHYVPEEVITTEELVASYNQYARRYNHKYAEKIAAGLCQTLQQSDAEFIINASGIKKRRVINKQGILSINTTRPLIKRRGNEELAFQSEFAIKAAQAALTKINRSPADVDGVIVACSNMQRAYPAIAIEVQNALGINGWAFDMNAACSSAVFGIHTAVNALQAGTAKSILVITPEIYTAHLNFTDRKSHFIFGDGSSAVLLEKNQKNTPGFTILSSRIHTKFSNNIRNNFGFLNRCENSGASVNEKLFVQNGHQVRAEVVPMVAKHLLEHLAMLNIPPEKIKRVWLHQANSNMNKEIARLVLGQDVTAKTAPTILAEYGNTGAAGVMITFSMFSDELNKGDLGIICAFGAGYSVGSLIVQKK